MAKFKADRRRYFSNVVETNPKTGRRRIEVAAHFSKKDADQYRLFRQLQLRSNDLNGSIYQSWSEPNFWVKRKFKRIK